MGRGVRQGFLASGFLFAMAFDPIIRWLQESELCQGTLTIWSSFSLRNVHTLTISLLLHHLFTK